MLMSFMQNINQRMNHALQVGALQPIQFHAESVHVQDMAFQVCWIPALSSLANNLPTGFPNGQQPDFNPFLPPDPNLTIGKLGDYHHVVLNKFPVCSHHLVIPRVDYADQRSPLQYEDFLALSCMLTEYGGLGFFNGGPQAGASQHHLHVQWLPDGRDHASLMPFIQRLDPQQDYLPQRFALWHFPHAFMYIGLPEDPYEYARELYHCYQLLCQQLRLTTCAQGFMAPLNLLIQQGWMLVVPRSQHQFNHISLNALSFAGMIYVREQEHIQLIKDTGVLQILQAVVI